MKGARRLAALIRKGHTMIGETRGYYYDGKCGCALGAAIAAVGLSHMQWIDNKYKDVSLDAPEVAADILGIPRLLARDVSVRHVHGTSRLEIAAWLDTLEPDDKAWAEEQVRKLLEGTPSATEAVNSPAETESK